MKHLCVIFLLSAAFSWNPAAAEMSVTIRDQEDAWPWTGFGSTPFVVEARSDVPTELRLAGTNLDGCLATWRIDLPAGETVRHEGFMPFPHDFTLSWSAAGQSGKKRMVGPGRDRSLLNPDHPPRLVSVNNVLFRELRNVPEAADVKWGSVAADSLPENWQAYYGFLGLLALDAEDLPALRDRQRRALTVWVRWLGGRLWLIGGNAAAAVEAGLLAGEPEPGAREAAALNGRVYFHSARDAEALPEFGGSTLDPLAWHYLPGSARYGERVWLLDGLGGMSTGMIITVLAGLGLLLGPVNYLYVRRKGREILFFVTTPLIALAGTAAILAAAVLGEGIGGTCNRHAVLVRGEADGEAMLFDWRGVYSGLYPPALSFDGTVLPLALEAGEDPQGYALDLSDSVRLDRGWLKSRFSTAFFLAWPAVSRTDLEVEREDGADYLANNLGFAVREAAVLLPGGLYGWAKDIPPGGRAQLTTEYSSARLDRLALEAARFAGDDGLALTPTLAAACEGLPNLQDGGMTARLVSGDYYYVRAASPGRERP